MTLKLKTRYLLSIVSVIIVTIIILTTAVSLQFKSTLINATSSSSIISEKNLLSQLEKRAEHMVLFLSEELVNDLYNYNMGAIYRTCAAALKQKNVAYIYVYDFDGHIVHDGTTDNNNLDLKLTDPVSMKAVSARKTIIQTMADIVDVATPIKIDDEIIGGIRIGLSADEIRIEISKMTTALQEVARQGLKHVLVSVVMIALILSIGGALLGAVLARRMSLPISYLSATTERIGRGDYDVDIPIQRSDEIGELAKSFRKMADELMKTTVSKTYVDNIIRHMIDLLVVIDTNGMIQTVNRATCRALGYTRQELLGSNISQIVNMEDVLGNQPIDVFIETGSAANFEARFRTSHGKTIPVLISSSIIGEKQNVDKILIIANDIRHIKETEKEKKRLESQLQQAQKMEALGTLAGGVAHDLNNILSGITSFPELMLMDTSREDPKYEQLTLIKESGERASIIVQDLLTLTRRGVAVTEVVNLNSIVDNYLNSPEYQKLKSLNPQVDIRKILADDLLNLEGSPVHLSKTVMNLVSNAVEAIPISGEISIKTENQYIDKPVKGYDDIEEGDYVILSISDTGIGINSYDIKRIFEPFYTKKVMGRSGTGLGMAVVWGTIKDHRGYIDIHSREEHGTTFKLYFPATRKRIPNEKPETSIDMLKGIGESVLIVDDVKEQREIASAMLTKLGYAVIALPSGEEAIEHLKDESVDILMLDMIMDPGMNGLETYRKISELHPGQKAIIASGYSETHLVKEAQSLGAGKYIKKPYTLENLGLAIKNELS